MARVFTLNLVSTATMSTYLNRFTRNQTLSSFQEWTLVSSRLLVLLEWIKGISTPPAPIPTCISSQIVPFLKVMADIPHIWPVTTLSTQTCPLNGLDNTCLESSTVSSDFLSLAFQTTASNGSHEQLTSIPPNYSASIQPQGCTQNGEPYYESFKVSMDETLFGVSKDEFSSLSNSAKTDTRQPLRQSRMVPIRNQYAIQKRTRAKYTPEMRAKVGKVRRIGACVLCSRSKVGVSSAQFRR
jgi:hypothetical protein